MWVVGIEGVATPGQVQWHWVPERVAVEMEMEPRGGGH